MHASAKCKTVASFDPSRRSARAIGSVILGLLVAASLSIGSPADAAPNLISDGAFEAPDLPDTFYISGPFGPWTFDHAVLVDTTSPAFDPWYGAAEPAGADGDQFVAIQYTAAMYQTFSAPSTSLNLSWLEAGRPDYNPNSCCTGELIYEVSLNGTAYGTFTSSTGSAFSIRNLPVSGLTPGAVYTLAFKGLTTASDETAFIDNVIATAVPEPGVWSLLILGFGCIGAAIRHRQMRPSSLS